MKTCKAPDSVTTLGLGSCVGVAVWDPLTKIGGLAHVMLPESSKIKNNTNIYKFADTCIEALVNELVSKGASRLRLQAKMAGGAQMFEFQNKSNMINVGQQNVEASKTTLSKLGVKLIASDTGLNYGRTVIFYPENGRFVIRCVGKEDKEI